MQKLTVREFGTTKKGETAHLYEMKNESGTAASVCDYGAALVSVLVKGKDGKPVDVVLGFDDVSGY
ncbi:MAG TPA: galactose-1-epimerase, partial [Candidatus Mediterraneibacter norfolkensis]|nr:galactose-1-epimerase [Candidatus Mediterraneibacter norfolkensis]